MSQQDDWQRRVLFVLGMDDQVEEPETGQPDAMLDTEEAKYLKMLLGMSDDRLISRSEVMRVISGAAAAFSRSSEAAMQSLPPGELKKLAPLEPKMGNSDSAEGIIASSFLEPYSPKDAEMVQRLYEEVVESTDLEVELLKARRPLESIRVKVDVDFEKMERRILGLDEEDDE